MAGQLGRIILLCFFNYIYSVIKWLHFKRNNIIEIQRNIIIHFLNTENNENYIATSAYGSELLRSYFRRFQNMVILRIQLSGRSA